MRSTQFVHWIALAALLAAASAAGPRPANVSITSFGGKGDGSTRNTDAINAAIKAVAAKGGGTISFPAGVFLSAPFNLSSHITLFFAKGSTLKATTDYADWPIIAPMPSYGQGRDHVGPRRCSFIGGNNLTDVVISGENATIDGSGEVWWQRHASGEEKYTRGHLIELMWSTDIEISHLTLTSSPFWTVHPVYSSGFWAHHLWILNPTTGAPNTDGIDPDSTSNVLIEDCYIRTGDDAIAIKSGWDEFGYRYNVSSSNITIRNSVFSSPCCAAVCIGSEMSGGVANVSVSNLTVWASAEGLRLKTGMGRGGYIRDISMVDSTISSSKTAFMYNAHYGGHPVGANTSVAPAVRGISVKRVSGNGNGQVADIEGLPQAVIQDVSFDDVDIGAKVGFKCEYTSGSSHNVTPAPCKELASASPK
eukprot:g2161.t1